LRWKCVVGTCSFYEAITKKIVLLVKERVNLLREVQAAEEGVEAGA
jgi:hypothetical protein